MEGAEPEPLGRPTKNGGDTLTHLAGGLVSEGDGQDLVRKCFVTQEDMGEPRGQDPGLAGAGPGEHEQRTVEGLDRQTLFGVQGREVFGHGITSVRRSSRAVRDYAVVAESGQSWPRQAHCWF